MEALGGVLGGVVGSASDAYEANVKADATVKAERERQRGIVNVVRTALPWLIGGLVVVTFIIFVIARRRKKATA